MWNNIFTGSSRSCCNVKIWVLKKARNLDISICHQTCVAHNSYHSAHHSHHPAHNFQHPANHSNHPHIILLIYQTIILISLLNISSSQLWSLIHHHPPLPAWPYRISWRPRWAPPRWFPRSSVGSSSEQLTDSWRPPRLEVEIETNTN